MNGYLLTCNRYLENQYLTVIAHSPDEAIDVAIAYAKHQRSKELFHDDDSKWEAMIDRKRWTVTKIRTVPAVLSHTEDGRD